MCLCLHCIALTCLHDEEVRVVDVQLYGVEEVDDLALLHRPAVDEVLVLSSDHHLPSDGNLVEVVVAHRAVEMHQI